MAYKRKSPQPVVEGGTGAVTLTGVLTGNGTSAITANAVTQYGTVVAGASNAVTSVAPSATAGIPFVSNGSSANPSYTTAVVAGGGTGVTTMTTAYAPVCAGTTATGALQVASTGLGTSGFVLTSTGASSLPSFQAPAGGGISTIDGDSGSVTGSTITLTGGSSGAVFTGSSTTLTESFNFLALPTTTSTNGQVTINSSPFMHSYGTGNTFLGSGAGNFTLTTANSTDNVAIGSSALSSATSSTANNVAIGRNAMSGVTTEIYQNTMIGDSVGSSFGGTQCVAIGTQAFQSGASSQGIAIGYQTLQNYSGSVTPIAIGAGSMMNAVNASGCVGIGTNTLIGVTGASNVAIGSGALNSITSGSNNVALGSFAGSAYSNGTEASNIVIGSGGVVGDANTLRIGSATGTSSSQLNKAFICGITGITVTGTAVLVSSTNQLGVSVSSKRFKDNIEDMNDLSSDILKLRPVSFNYTVGDDKSQQSGLIAEEVHDIMPSLVVYDQEGLPQTVKYHDLPALLLNELQKAIKRIEVLESKLANK